MTTCFPLSFKVVTVAAVLKNHRFYDCWDLIPPHPSKMISTKRVLKESEVHKAITQTLFTLRKVRSYFLFWRLILFYACECFACMYVYALCELFGACEGHKRASDALEIELWMAVNHHVGAGNWTQVPLQVQQLLLTSESSLDHIFRVSRVETWNILIHYL